MPSNPFEVATPNISGRLADIRQENRLDELFRENTEMAQLRKQQLSGQVNQQEQDRQLLSKAIAAQHSMKLFDEQGAEVAAQWLDGRVAELEGMGLDPSQSRKAAQMFRSGQGEQLRPGTAQLVQEAQTRGLTDTPNPIEQSNAQLKNRQLSGQVNEEEQNRQIKSTAIAAQQALGILDEQGPAAASKFLQDRRAQLIQANLDPSDTVAGIQLLANANGGEAQFRQAAGQIIGEAQARGLMDKPATREPNTKLEKLFEFRDTLPQGDSRRAAVDAAIAKESTRANGLTLTTNPDGTFTFTQGGSGVTNGIGSPRDLNKNISREDAGQIQASRESATAAQPSKVLLNRARELLVDVNTGKGAGLVKLFNQLGAVAGSESAEAQAAAFEEFDSISKELGAQALQMFGGSDTEKELEIAINTNPELGKTDTANANIIKRKLHAIDVLEKRPDFESQWLQRNGSLVNPDTNTGEFFGKSWRRFQQESFGSGGSIQVGDVEDGYRYLGGDKSDPHSWERADG